MHIWLFCGYAGSGKTTVASIVEKLLPNAYSTAFGKTLKDDVAKLWNINRSSMETQEGKVTVIKTNIPNVKTVRDLLIHYSALVKEENKDNYVWAKCVSKEIAGKETVLIHDWRYMEELTHLCVTFPLAKITTVRVLNPRVSPMEDPSENQLAAFVPTYTIVNDGEMHELESTVAQICKL